MTAYWTREERETLDQVLRVNTEDAAPRLSHGEMTRILATVDALEKESHTAMVLLLQSNDSEWLDHGRRLYDLLAALEGK